MRFWPIPKFLENFEARMDSFTPKTEVTEQLEKNYTDEEFQALMDRLLSERGLKLKSDANDVYVLTVNGWKFGDRQETKDIYPNDAIAEMFMDSKSRLEFHRLEDGTVQVSSFEHIPGSKQQAADYKLVLALRMKQLLSKIQ